MIAGKYRIDELIAESAHSRIYRAIQMSLERPLAIRRFRSETDEAVRSRVTSEARVCASLGHPNVLEVYELGEDDGPFVAMELLNGESLRSRLARSARLDLEVVAKVGAELLGALGAAHRARAVHPNLSVDEVFIAERRGGDLTKLRGFRPVEESRDDPRADLHQAGRVIYEALTGEAPPTSDDDRLPPGPSELRDDLGLDADAFASRALAPTADERFQSADEMLDAWSSIEALSSHLI